MHAHACFSRAERVVMKKVLTVILILLMIGLSGFFVYEVVYNKTPVQENLFRYLLTLCALIISCIRLNARMGQGSRRRSLDFYETYYEKEIGSAFRDKPVLRKKLLCAIRLYNEDSIEKALKYLKQLLPACKNKYDARAVLLFMGLCFSDMGLCEYAIKTYYRLLEQEPDNARTYSNIGLEYYHQGNRTMAMEHYEKAIALDPAYAQAYNNMARCYFDQHDFETAIDYADKALERNQKQYQAASLLAIIYALLGDGSKQETYFQIAVSAGENAEALRATIQRYLKEQDEILQE